MTRSDSQIDKPQHVCALKRAELLDVNINTGVQTESINSLGARAPIKLKLKLL